MKPGRLKAYISLTISLTGFLSLQVGIEDEGLEQNIRVVSEWLAQGLETSPTLRYHISNPRLSWEFSKL